MISSACLVFHTNKKGVAEMAKEYTEMLEQNSVEVRMLEDEAGQIARPDLRKSDQLCRESDILLVLGGDGTILRAVHHLVDPPPILGINLGKFGFLSAVNPIDGKDALKKIIDQGLNVEERYRLDFKLTSQEQVFEAKTLNEIVISRPPREHLINIQARIFDGAENDSDFTFSADGVMVSTATGSTAYSLSLGGPIVSPESACLIFMAMAPHTLAQRALVLSHGFRILLSVTENSHFSWDGQNHWEGSNYQVEIKLGSPIKIVKIEENRFFTLLKDKLDYCKTR